MLQLYGSRTVSARIGAPVHRIQKLHSLLNASPGLSRNFSITISTCRRRFGSSPRNSSGSAARIFSSSSPRSRFSRADIFGFAPFFFATVPGFWLVAAADIEAVVSAREGSGGAGGGVGGRRAAAAAASAARTASRAARAFSSAHRIASALRALFRDETTRTCSSRGQPKRRVRRSLPQ